MPPVSEKQRRAMAAAAAGRGNIGISKKVGAEFISADPGGPLPQAAKPAKAAKPQGLSKLVKRQAARRR